MHVYKERQCSVFKAESVFFINMLQMSEQ